MVVFFPLLLAEAKLLNQPELSHRNPKSWFFRTDRKKYTKQMAQIERRQARLRRIRTTLKKAGKPSDERIPSAPTAHHVFGKSQNHPEHIPSFLQQNKDDPAVAVRSFAPIECSDRSLQHLNRIFYRNCRTMSCTESKHSRSSKQSLLPQVPTYLPLKHPCKRASHLPLWIIPLLLPGRNGDSFFLRTTACIAIP